MNEIINIASAHLLIMCMRICDVSIDTFRMILVVQGKKYLAGTAGFFEVLIWIFAIRFIMQHLDNIANFLVMLQDMDWEISLELLLNKK